MKRLKVELLFNENTIKWAKEKAQKQNVDYKIYLESTIENIVFREYVDGLFEPVKYQNKKYKHRKSDKNDKRKNSSLQYNKH